MEPMLWIDTTDLKNWSETRDCQGYLPLLIRHLIRGSTSNISQILFPGGDSVSSPGWDGILEASEGNEYIPEGISVWEMGCNQKIKTKADKDYEKRKTDSLGLNPSETIYVFVTPRRWKNKKKWCSEKRKEGFWKDVKVYDANDLEEWIEQIPTVGITLGERLGKYPKGVKALGDWGKKWNKATSPQLTPKLVLSGRESQLKSVQEWLKSSSRLLSIQASTSDESIAFLAAAIAALPEEERKFYLSRSVVVYTSKDFEHIATTGRKGLLLIPKFADINVLSVATEKGHFVYVPIGPDNTVVSPEIHLPRLGRDEFISAMKEMGIPEEVAQKYSRDTGRSLTVLRRKLSSHAKQPEWAKKEFAHEIIPALIAGRWDESNDSDTEIISDIADISYESFSKELYSWQKQPDSPVVKIGNLWRLISPMDAFFALAPFITADNLKKFKINVLKILRTLNPALELEPEKRWMAAVYDKIPEYSSDLRKGIIQTLILIAVFGDDSITSLPTKAQDWVDEIILELLHDAECNLWISLVDVLPLIAEASPNSFMDAVESSLSDENKPILCLFGEIDGIMGPSSSHSSLLWALETLAWDPDLLPRVTLILGELAKNDPNPESRLINRPSRSLREIFLLWRPQTYASLEIRLEILDLLIDRYPEVGWKLLVDLMPKNHDVGHPTSRPIWRQFSDDRGEKTPMADYTSVKEIISLLLTHAEYESQRWVNIMENYSALPDDERKKTIQKLSLDVGKISEGRDELCNTLRRIISHHRSFPDSDWSLDEEELEDLEKLYRSLEPIDTIDRNCWLFDKHRPHLIEGIKRDHEEAEKIIHSQRSDAIQSIKKEYGFEGLIKLAEQIENPEILGETLALQSISPTEEDELYTLLESKNKSLLIFVQKYIFRKSFNDEQWTKDLVDKANSDSWPDLKVINCFLAFPSRMEIWNHLKSFNTNVKQSYWKQCEFRGISGELKDKIYFLKHMLKFKRYFSALDTAALHVNELPPDLVAEILTKAVLQESEEELRINDWDIERIFEELYKSDYPKNEIAKLEWLYLPFLASVSSERSPKMLHKELAENSEFFTEVIKYVYKRKDGTLEKETDKIPGDLLEQRYMLSSKLLRSWHSIPGTEDDGKINSKTLELWVKSARDSCKKIDRIGVCDSTIGKLLANAEPEDGIWPPEPICKIIEEINSENLRIGFYTGIINKRGTFTKSLDEGGIQENELAQEFSNYAKNLNTRFPKTATILNQVADHYKTYAKREDDEAEARDLEY